MKEIFQGNFRQAANLIKKHRNFEEGMLLRNITDDGFYTYLNFTCFRIEPKSNLKDLIKDVTATYSDAYNFAFDKSQKHNIGTFMELATTATPEVAREPRKPSNQTTAFLIAGYKLLPEANDEVMDQTWAAWSGARIMYQQMPKCMADPPSYEPSSNCSLMSCGNH
ncbi:PREDICTED: uncharacterized protein LOC106821475 [Priapulus caudatus]|uniref:Uncharacterized protein LOC106821475 n=1 Tax=Priapulus caudatus TaxID=37621 RepID=A0ABM1FBG5_PRICU|nr:PREDICTED: uncharacterized protein LOC106821475 [Priapulus caudatus]